MFKQEEKRVEIIYFVPLSVRVSVLKHGAVFVEWQRGLTCSLETIWIGVYLLANTELVGIKILRVIRGDAMFVSLNDKVTKLQKKI